MIRDRVIRVSVMDRGDVRKKKKNLTQGKVKKKSQRKKSLQENSRGQGQGG